ncbi:MAG: DUF2470 domain-containing protein [Pseudomonadota bacterium]
MATNDVRNAVDDDAIRLAKTLLRTERHGALAVLDPATGTPLASRVAVASDQTGAPLILISRLSAHFNALEADPRCSILLGVPGAGDPLAHPRMTVMARAERLEGADRDLARGRFLARNPKAALYADFPDFAFWRLSPTGADLNAGFGKAYLPDAADILIPADPDLGEREPGAVEHMNDDHSESVKLYAEVLMDLPEGNWTLATIDPEGMEVICGDQVARYWFDPPLANSDEMRVRLVTLHRDALAKKG